MGIFERMVGLLAPDAARGAYNDWRLVATTTLDGWVLLFLAAGLVAAIFFSGLGMRRLPLGRRVLLLGLRIFAAVWVMILVVRPAIELRAVSRVRTRVALLVDSSKSMSLATPDGARSEAVAENLERNRAQLALLAEQAVIEPVLFGERTHPQERLPEPLPHDDNHTDLGRALGEISIQSSGRELGAVIIYSDGTDTEGLTVEQAKKKAAKLGVPVYAVGFDSDSSAPDLAVKRVVADDFAFVHNTVTLDVELSEHGIDLNRVMVTLKQDGNVVQTKEASFSDGQARVTFEFKPHRTGKQVYQISVPVQPGEAVAGNNQKSVVLKVIRDRIRVLQVAGRPSWDERFLRELLKRNPNVDLISFFILRSTTDLQKAAQEELALIPFPVHELFTSELGSFDVVIYQNFSYRPYRMSHYLPNIRDYVEKGGSFLMIGGDTAFEEGWYAGTPIAEILPVQLGGVPGWDTAPFKPRLTKEGRRHPVTRIGESGEPAEAVFGRLPALEGFNGTLGLAPGSQALLQHPSLPGNPPVVAVRDFGQGRTMAVTTDNLWSWRFLAVGEGGAGREFDRFWSNALLWLIRDPELARVRAKAERSVVLKWDPIGVEVQVLGSDYRGLPNAQVSAELVKLDEKVVSPAKEMITGPDGNVLFVFEGAAPGAYVLRARADVDGELLGRAEEPIIVEGADIELQAPLPRPDLMRAMADASGGEFVDIGDNLPTISLKDARRVEVDRTRRVPIWDTWVAFLILLVAASAEWWLRRRAGLL